MIIPKPHLILYYPVIKILLELRGFGTFKVRLRKGRAARNPRTGEPCTTSNHRAIVFRPGQELKDRV